MAQYSPATSAGVATTLVLSSKYPRARCGRKRPWWWLWLWRWNIDGRTRAGISMGRPRATSGVVFAPCNYLSSLQICAAHTTYVTLTTPYLRPKCQQPCVCQHEIKCDACGVISSHLEHIDPSLPQNRTSICCLSCYVPAKLRGE